MHFNLLSIFPDFFTSPLANGLLAKAVHTDLISFKTVNPRDFTDDPHKSVDDRPYGGGPGMVMTLEPVLKALKSLDKPGRILLMTPAGRPFKQETALALSREPVLTLICGRYEGLDARLEKILPIEKISIGDFILNGGESAALCVIEAISRLLQGFMGKQDSALEESFASGLLEYPHFSRPENYRGHRVPEVLLSGDHKRIAAWRRQQALLMTMAARPELLSNAEMTRDEALALGSSSEREMFGRNLHIGLLHYPVLGRNGEILISSLTNLDVHDIVRNSRSYGLGRFYVQTPLEDQRALLEELLEHWTVQKSSKINPDRAEALSLVKPVVCLEQILDDISRRFGQRPRIVATSAKPAAQSEISPERVRDWLHNGPVLLILGTAWGLAPEIIEQADGMLRPIRFLDGYNHLPVRSAAAIMLDRILGDAF